ncbi:MAG: TSUP family transporter [Bdellovibrionales bacterium]|nr:TSUP family transporter [Bdellovibrionales bacterium]
MAALTPETGLALFFTGGAAGFIDSIAGGGGLITLPALSIALEPGVTAIATNKINGAVAAGVAMAVYFMNRSPGWRKGIPYALAVGAGSILGSLCTPLVPREWLRVFMILALPPLLMMVWNKDRWVKFAQSHPPEGRLKKRFWAAATLVGFYDGAFGPGGGTFMLLVPVAIGGFPLALALLVSKMANTASASFSLVSYAAQGHVHWAQGAVMASGMAIGAFGGARLATKHAARMVRPALLVALLLLMVKLISESFGA